MTQTSTRLKDRAPALLLGLAMLLVPFRILSRGFMPIDDPLRHAAFAVQGRPWSEIIVGRPGAVFDQSPGWHAILKGLHAALGWNQETLVAASIAGLLLLFFAAGLAWVRRWEAWVLSLLLLFLSEWGYLFRFAEGRPFIVTSVVCLAVLASARQRGEGWSWHHGAFALGSALATWIHGSWYLLFLPVVALGLSGRPREAVRTAATILAGVLLGACLTGQPVAFLAGQLRHLLAATGRSDVAVTLVDELRPLATPFATLIVVGFVLLWDRERIRKADLRRDPLLWMAFLGWLLGFSVMRFYADFGVPALALWLALHLDGILGEASWMATGRRLGFAALLACSFLVVCSADVDGRWSRNDSSTYLDAARPELAGWLPDPGGIVYAVDMRVYYQTFFRNPDAPWSYVLGHEPAMMKAEDRAVVDRYNPRRDLNTQLAPWLAKFTARDRLVLLAPPGTRPQVAGLEWAFVGPDKWIGRPPRPAGPH